MWSSERFLWPLCSSSCSAVLQFRLSLKGFVSPTLCDVAAESPASSRCEIPSSPSPKGELTASVPVAGTMAPALKGDRRCWWQYWLQSPQACGSQGRCNGAGSAEQPHPLNPARTAGPSLHCPGLVPPLQALPPRKPSESGSVLPASRRGIYLNCKPCGGEHTGGESCFSSLWQRGIEWDLPFPPGVRAHLNSCLQAPWHSCLGSACLLWKGQQLHSGVALEERAASPCGLFTPGQGICPWVHLLKIAHVSNSPCLFSSLGLCTWVLVTLSKAATKTIQILASE